MASPRTPSTPTHSPQQKKRLRGTPTFLTPHRPMKRQPLREKVAQEGSDNTATCTSHSAARVSLVFESRGRGVSLVFESRGRGGFISWKIEELKALVEFILLMHTSDKWPTHQRMHFWECASEFVQSRTASRHKRTGINSWYQYNMCSL